MDYSPPDSSIHGIFHARILEWVAIPFSREKGILFLTQGSNLGLKHCRRILYYLSHQGSPQRGVKLTFVFLFIQPENLCILIDIFNTFLLIWFLVCSVLNLLCYYLFSMCHVFSFFPSFLLPYYFIFPLCQLVQLYIFFTSLFTVTLDISICIFDLLLLIKRTRSHNALYHFPENTKTLKHLISISHPIPHLCVHIIPSEYLYMTWSICIGT